MCPPAAARARREDDQEGGSLRGERGGRASPALSTSCDYLPPTRARVVVIQAYTERRRVVRDELPRIFADPTLENLKNSSCSPDTRAHGVPLRPLQEDASRPLPRALMGGATLATLRDTWRRAARRPTPLRDVARAGRCRRPAAPCGEDGTANFFLGVLVAWVYWMEVHRQQRGTSALAALNFSMTIMPACLAHPAGAVAVAHGGVQVDVTGVGGYDPRPARIAILDLDTGAETRALTLPMAWPDGGICPVARVMPADEEGGLQRRTPPRASTASASRSERRRQCAVIRSGHAAGHNNPAARPYETSSRARRPAASTPRALRPGRGAATPEPRASPVCVGRDARAPRAADRDARRRSRRAAAAKSKTASRVLSSGAPRTSSCVLRATAPAAHPATPSLCPDVPRGPVAWRLCRFATREDTSRARLPRGRVAASTAARRGDARSRSGWAATATCVLSAPRGVRLGARRVRRASAAAEGARGSRPRSPGWARAAPSAASGRAASPRLGTYP